MKKQPALITRYKTATAEIETLKASVAELEKKLKDATSSKDLYCRTSGEHAAEVEQIQTLLDVLPNTPARRSPDSYTDTKAITRLAAYLAQR